MAEKTKNPCHAEKVSEKVEGHIHDCMGDHAQGQTMHFCTGCKEWWGKKNGAED